MAEVIADTCNLSEDDESPQHGLGEDEKHLQLAESDMAFRAMMSLLEYEYDKFEEVTKLIGQLGGALREVKPESSVSDESMPEETPEQRAQRYMSCGQSEAFGLMFTMAQGVMRKKQNPMMARDFRNSERQQGSTTEECRLVGMRPIMRLQCQ